MAFILVLVLAFGGANYEIELKYFDGLDACMSYGTFINPMDILIEWDCQATGYRRV